MSKKGEQIILIGINSKKIPEGCFGPTKLITLALLHEFVYEF